MKNTPKSVKMMILQNCYFCKQALKMMDQLVIEHPEYKQVKIEVIEERQTPEKTKGYDYWYVPTFFVEDKKIHEGVPTVEKVEKVFIEALS